MSLFFNIFFFGRGGCPPWPLPMVQHWVVQHPFKLYLGKWISLSNNQECVHLSMNKWNFGFFLALGITMEWPEIIIQCTMISYTATNLRTAFKSQWNKKRFRPGDLFDLRNPDLVTTLHRLIKNHTTDIRPPDVLEDRNCNGILKCRLTIAEQDREV